MLRLFGPGKSVARAGVACLLYPKFLKEHDPTSTGSKWFLLASPGDHGQVSAMDCGLNANFCVRQFVAKIYRASQKD